jgi:hypothetical protein
MLDKAIVTPPDGPQLLFVPRLTYHFVLELLE